MADDDPIPAHYQRTPDGRYYIVDQKLWRCANPNLPSEERALLTAQLASARAALKSRNASNKALARQRVLALRMALGEVGPVWWDDGAPDYSRSFARITPYADWYADLTGQKIKAPN